MSTDVITGGSRTLLRQMFVCVFAVMASLGMVSCSDDGHSGEVNVIGDQAALQFSAPEMLLQSRAVVQQNLILQVSIEGRVIVVPPDVNSDYIFRTTVTPNTSIIVSIEWFELIGDRKLLLATARQTLNVGSVSSPATLRFSEFNTSIDDDNDGSSNLRERQENTNYDDSNDPAMAPVIVTLDFRLFMPSELENAPDQVRSQVSAQAFVNDQAVSVFREGDEWRGTVNVTENADPLIAARFFATSEQTLQIAEFSRSENVGQGANVDFLADDYDVDSFNTDGDAFSNAQEIAEGSDPLDPRDPDDDQDGIADDADNCPADSNSDQADADGDNLGDACDPFNNLVDPDEDGVSNSASPPDNCPTDANNNQADVDNDGIGDVCDPFNNVTDPDEDGVGNNDMPPDNCPVDANPNQVDSDGDGIGDVCELPNVAPIADAGQDRTIVEGTVLQLNGGGSTDTDGTVVSYQWLENGVAFSTDAAVAIANLTQGVYTYQLVVTDNAADSGTDEIVVTVTAAPPVNVPPTAFAGADLEIVEGTVLQLNGGGSTDTDGTVVSYQWLENGVAFSTDAAVAIANLTQGVYTYQLVVTDNAADSGTDEIVVTVTAAPPVNVPPTAFAGADLEIVEGTVLQLNGGGSTDTDGTVVSYQWLENGVAFSTDAAVAIADLTEGVYTYQLVVTDNAADSGTDEIVVTVTAAPPVNVPPTAFAGADLEIVEGTVLQLNGGGSTDTDGTVVSYQWLENGVAFSTDAAVAIANLTQGVYTYQLVVTDDAGDSGTDEIVVTVTAAPPVNVPPTAFAGADLEIVEGTVLQLNGGGSTDTDGTVVSYQWLENGVAFSTDAAVAIANLTQGVYTYQLVVTDNAADSGTDEIVVTVTAATAP